MRRALTSLQRKLAPERFMNEPKPNTVVASSDPRRHVFLSSTGRDLQAYRDAAIAACNTLQLIPVGMEFFENMGRGATAVSLDKLATCQLFVGFYAYRYGFIEPDGDPRSVTEREFDAAAGRMERLCFLMSDDHPWPMSRAEKSQFALQDAFREKVRLLAAREFTDIENFRRLLEQALGAWLKRQSGDLPPTAVVKPRLPAPPNLYAVPNYILTSTFIGRATELDELDAWACSNDPVMVVEGIGGLGKSALTWEWTINRAAKVIPDLAGRVWWSFYERGASMSAFVRHALAYITGQDPDALSKETSHYQRCQELLTELKRRPFLLVLDGFERVLTAYQRWDKAQQRDDKIEANLRECADPRDGELLQQLLHGSPSKVILSTRLFPSILEDRASARPIPGVAHHHLNGLSRPDARDFFRHAGIKGDEKAMLEFADQFGRHSLLLKVICGEIAQYPRKPFNFDAWRADPIYGGKLKLSELDLKQRYNHILRFALEGLDEQKRKLLCRIAVLSEGADYDTIAVLNPYLPPEPREPTKDALREPHESVENTQAILAFDKALKDFHDRGLLQRDRDTGHYDMHAVVRGHAAEFLEGGDRKQTFLTLRDHFAGLPPDDFEKATELPHVAHSLEIYRCLVGAGLFDDAVSFYWGDLANTLCYHLGANTLIVELLTPLLCGGRDGLPCLTSASHRSQIINDLAFASYYLGRREEALTLFTKALGLALEEKDWRTAGTNLHNIAFSARSLDHRSMGADAFILGLGLADAGGDGDRMSSVILNQAADAIDQGRFCDGERLLGDFHARGLPNITIYRPGEAERRCCVSTFYQGTLTESDWQRGYEIAVEHRNVVAQNRFLAHRAEWLLTKNQATLALDAIDDALKIVNRLGTPSPDYHDLRAWALAKLGSAADARAELANGEQRRYAAEAWLILGDREQARTCALNAYRWAWGEGPPYIMWYDLERSRALLRELGEPEPQLPPFDPSKVKPIPYEAEIRAAIAKLKAEKESQSKNADEDGK